ncbi:hypothetical protein [Marixanthomonas spongiae]|uniref:Uncharacterized protein n=1 Tax=Marixanthomonas spongiae TaxID=2174845 RepID=A0A2U0I5M4_9FLAO|nr:hypothetical protein [Marixanthomonas spongiae]PVW16407.1 hypothetical protein DDV96_03880 [Marixanthomonas spongiae]
MSKRDEILREILSEPDILSKYNLKASEVEKLTTNPPYFNNAVEILATVINENDNNRTSRQIYPILKNIHKI